MYEKEAKSGRRTWARHRKGLPVKALTVAIEGQHEYSGKLGQQLILVSEKAS